ncbi:hypothetical protein ALC57_10587, partial [Trachymyrmex cornetzi]
SWILRTFWVGYHRDLEVTDLYTPLKEHTSDVLGDKRAVGIILCSAINVFVTHLTLMGITHMNLKFRVACYSLIYRKTLKMTRIALSETTIGQIVNLLSNDINRFEVYLVFLHSLYVVWTFRDHYPHILWLGRKSSELRSRIAIKTNESVRFTNEIISGIQAIKMYTVSTSFIIFTTRISLFITVLAYTLFGYKITAEKVFMISAYYSCLCLSMAMFLPQGIRGAAEMIVTVKRLKKFLMCDELISSKIETKKNSKENNKDAKNNKESKEENAKEDLIEQNKKDYTIEDQPKYVEYSISIKNGSAKWENTLHNININVRPNELIAIVGQVGAGKSSLMNVILKELRLHKGFIQINGKIAYASQEPWLFAGSVRQNILFGRNMEQIRYNHVIEVCQLKRDFSLLPYGDKRIIGERGISLSGSQRVRTYDELSSMRMDFDVLNFDMGFNHQQLAEKNVDKYRKVHLYVIRPSFQNLKWHPLPLNISKFPDSHPEEVDDLENLFFVFYFFFFSFFRMFLIFLFFLSLIFFISFTRFFKNMYIHMYVCFQAKFIMEIHTYLFNIAYVCMYLYQSPLTRMQCIYIYSGLIVLTVCITLIRSWTFFMFRSINRATVRFFNNNTSGRILNRFSKDMGGVDEMLPTLFMDSVQISLWMLSITVLVAISNVWLLIPTAFVGIVFYYLRIFYLATSRSVKCLEGTNFQYHRYVFQWSMRQSAELENQMTSVELIFEYSKVDSEPPLESIPDKKPKSEWPQEGKIEFKNVFLRYAPLEPPVLKDLTFVIFPREKIGIVGRTGAGKSSLIQALFHLTNVDGLIEIDRVDTSQIGLHDLRSKISIIPQEPYLFSGSLRRNLDPFNSYTDELLWQALKEEFDHPHVLLQKETGYLKTMVQETGKQKKKILAGFANDCYQNRALPTML